MGGRLLRTNILQPSSSLQVIEQRLDAVQEIIESDSLLFNSQTALKPMADLDHIISNITRVPARNNDIHYVESKINHVICLKILLEAVKGLVHNLSPCTSTLLASIHEVSFYKRFETLLFLLTPSCFQILSDPLLGKQSATRNWNFMFTREFGILDEFYHRINETLHDDVGIQKTSLALRHQRCYAVRVTTVGNF